MAPPTLPTYSSRSGNAQFDPTTNSDNEEEDDNKSTSSRSTWASTSSATILGFSDGYVNRTSTELNDWRISRIGGSPSFPPMFAPQLEPASSICQACSCFMPLLTQIYCPLDSSSLERILYVFGCPKSTCRGQSGSVRCWRASVPWVEEDSEEEKDEEEEARKALEEETKKEGNQLGNLIFGEGSSLFGSTTLSPPPPTNFNPFAPAPPINLSSNPFAPTPPSVELESLNLDSASKPKATPSKTPRVKAPLPPSPKNWSSPPSFPAQYLTTAYEPPSSISSMTIPASAVILPAINEDAKHRDGKGAGGRIKKGANVGGTGTGTGTGGGDEWGREGYEVQKVKGVDEVFLGFQERVSREGKQCIRYDHTSTPLPFSSTSKPYTTLFPASSLSDDQPLYNPSLVSTCPHCSQSKTFELQLMPYLVSLLNKSMSLQGCTALAREDSASKGKEKKNVMEEDGLDWASVWIFTCLGECLPEGQESGWREEECMIEWEEQ